MIKRVDNIVLGVDFALLAVPQSSGSFFCGLLWGGGKQSQRFGLEVEIFKLSFWTTVVFSGEVKDISAEYFGFAHFHYIINYTYRFIKDNNDFNHSKF